MKREYIVAQRVVLCDNCENAEELLAKKPLQTNFTKTDCALIRQGGYVLLDFGRELSGGIKMSVQSTSAAPECARCRIVFGESVAEAQSRIGFKNATNDHSIRDTIIDVNSMSTMTYGLTGFRFVKLEAVYGDIFIKAINACHDIRDIEYKGSFECSDDRLNKIWRTGAYTVHLCMNDLVIEGIKRDRLVWIGDMAPEVSVISAVFGYDASVPASLNFVRNEYPPDMWMNKIPAYSLWWIIIHYEWYMQNGDLQYLAQQEDYLCRLMEHIIPWALDREKSPQERFTDWSSKSQPESAYAGLYALVYRASLAAGRIFRELDNHGMAEKCDGLAKAVKAMDIKAPHQKQMAALCVYSGLCDAGEVNRDILSQYPLKGLSAFMGYYVLRARAMAGDTEGALNVIRGYWGSMLDIGATAFWEEFDVEWTRNASRIDEPLCEEKRDIHGDCGSFCYEGYRKSLCHGWAAGPTAFLSQYVLGIKIIEPGCKKIMIDPKLGDLAWAKGSYPTPYGVIRISHAKQNGKVMTDVEFPGGIEAQFAPTVVTKNICGR